MGILKCSGEASTESARNLPIYICSDSQSSLKAISAVKINSALVAECRDQVQLLALKNPVTLVWVPGHNDIHGNDIADVLAKAGVEKTCTGPEPHLKAPPSYFKGQITKWKNMAFTNHWKSIIYARQSKNCISLDAKKSRFILSLSRRNIRRLTSIFTGHTFSANAQRTFRPELKA